MNYFDSLFLGALQGITEFLPISSSGHLVILEHLLGLKVEALKSFDVSLHIGSLVAILFYFRKDFYELFATFFKSIFKLKIDFSDAYTKMIFYLVAGSIPAVVVGVLFEDQIDTFFRNSRNVFINMIIVGVIFLLAEFVYKKYYKNPVNEVGKIGIKNVIIIGIAQAIAIIPGVSRSGSTITAGLFCGVKREIAARFSFLLGSIAIFGAGLLTAIKELKGESDFALVGFSNLSLGFFSSLVFSFLAISFLMKFLKNHSLAVFAVYRIAIGVIGLL
ncbi:MAG: undecaprenyl-diphosphatase UppP [Candidatus Gracilibacteria bacterium]|jgi:undecaprenyl-diphosphatase